MNSKPPGETYQSFTHLTRSQILVKLKMTKFSHLVYPTLSMTSFLQNYVTTFWYKKLQK